MHLLSIDDLGPEDARQVIDRAEQLRRGCTPRTWLATDRLSLS